MNILIPPNKIYNHEQELTFNNTIITLMGKNGSGKSAILEKIFESYLNDDSKKVICFSSGQNESFSPMYNEFLSQKRKDLIRESFSVGIDRFIPSFFFDVTWTKVLIFFATALKPDGLVRKFLFENDYIDIDEDNDDMSSVLDFSFRVTGLYAQRIQQIYRIEANNPLYNSIRKTVVHEYLIKLIEAIEAGGEDYAFERALPKNLYTLDAYRVLQHFDNDVNQIFTFLWYSTYNGDFINLNDCKLRFERTSNAIDSETESGEEERDMELNDLSDGEFILLVFYALVDLFDSSNTLFIFDEIDSHLYYENVVKVWSALNTINGKVITSTHSADSIILNNLSDLMLVEQGIIKTLDSELLYNRLESLARIKQYQYWAVSKLKHLILMDSEFDWFIFKNLAQKVIQDFSEEKISQLHFFKKSCTYSSSKEQFGNSKLFWVQEIFQTVDSPMIKNAFLVCDRDELPINDISRNNMVQFIHGGAVNLTNTNNDKKIAWILSWRRREIENYLISYTLLQAKGMLIRVNAKLPPIHQLRQGQNMDNLSVQTIDIKGTIQPLYLKEGVSPGNDVHETGVDYVKLQQLIDLIPPSEISEDIEKMYHFIISKIN